MPCMDIAAIWSALSGTIHAIPRYGLLVLALGAMVVGWVGAVMIRRRVPMGSLVRGGSTLVLVGVLVTVVLQLSRFDPRIDVAVPQFGLPEQIVEGGETRVQMSADGHFWIAAQINGADARFLVDTGATLTAVSGDLASAAGLQARRGGIPVQINTANGSVAAQLTTIDELRFGNVAARGLDAVIAPSLGNTNVLGMNVLSRLASWRVEGETMILVPNNPQPIVGGSDG